MGAMVLLLVVAGCGGTRSRGEVNGEVPGVDQAVYADASVFP